MKTADLIARLAADTTTVPNGAVARRLAPLALAGVIASAVIVLLWLGLRSLPEAAQTFPFWMKASYTGLLAITATAFVGALSRPGGRTGRARWIAIVAIGVMLGLSAAEFITAPADVRLRLWLGGSWNLCPFRIVVLAAPIYVCLLLGMRRLAPTRLAAAGATAGFLAGALGATVYQLFCPETGAMFVTTWYSAGIMASTVIGAIVGARALRW